MRTCPACVTVSHNGAFSLCRKNSRQRFYENVKATPLCSIQRARGSVFCEIQIASAPGLTARYNFSNPLTSFADASFRLILPGNHDLPFMWWRGRFIAVVEIATTLCDCGFRFASVLQLRLVASLTPPCTQRLPPRVPLRSPSPPATYSRGSQHCRRGGSSRNCQFSGAWRSHFQRDK